MIAAAIVTALYALILAIGQDPLPSAMTRYQPTPRTMLRQPEPLLPIEGEVTVETVAGPATTATSPVPVTVHLVGVTAGADREVAGIATFHTITGGDFRWRPLSTGKLGPDGEVTFRLEAQRGTPLTITFAAARTHARHGYIDRETLFMRQEEAATGSPPAPSEPSVTLSGATYAIKFDLPEGIEQAGPLRLRRVDDQQWLPMLHTTAGIELRQGEPMALQLAAGVYELQAPLTPEKAQSFSVPDVDTVTVTLGFARAQTDRR